MYGHVIKSLYGSIAAYLVESCMVGDRDDQDTLLACLFRSLRQEPHLQNLHINGFQSVDRTNHFSLFNFFTFQQQIQRFP